MLSKLRSICEAIEFGAEPDEVLKVIAMQITHSSKGGRFLIGEWFGKSSGRTILNTGFAEVDSNIYVANFLPCILESQLESLIEIDHNLEYQEKFKKVFGFEDSSSFKNTLIYYSEDLNRVLVFSNPSKQFSRNRRDFQDILKVLLILYGISFRRPKPKSAGLDKKQTSTKGNPLSERQKLILDLIRVGRTNPEIADVLGYSESLIRQETVTIYRKLGVAGRKEIEILK